MTKLVIVESPSKAKKIKEILGAGYIVSASVGHVRDLPERDIGIDLETFKPQYVLTDRGADVIKKLSELVASADHVYLATDPDREGEAIAWHLKAALKLSKYSRITFNEVTASAVKKAVESPREIDMSLVAAQESRRILDRLVGWQASPILWDAVAAGTSAGRVQSPAVRLVVERERAIRDFKKISHFGVRANFPGGWYCDLDTKKSRIGDDPDFYMLDRALAEQIASIKNFIVDRFQDSEKYEAPPAPFTTSSLQQAASITLKIDPAAAMQAAQKLFEGGHITYHRTDSPNLSDDGYALACDAARSLSLKIAEKRRHFQSKDGAQEAHEAIRPTHFEHESAGESDNEKALYKLIRSRTIASVLIDARYAVRAIEIKSGDYIFAGRGRSLIDPGWRAVYQETDDSESESEPENTIPALSVGNQIIAESSRVIEKSTKPPARYTQASLIAKLESSGIGRPATYAAIMQKIVERQYISQDEKRRLRATALGEQVIDALAGHVGFCDYDYTASVENDLDAIAHKKTDAKSVLSSAQNRLLADLSTIKAAAPVYGCAACGKPMRRMNGKNGPFWSCSGYPDCKNTRPDASGKPGEKIEGGPIAADKSAAVYFTVSYDDRDKAKKIGLRWDGDKKSWYAPDSSIATLAKKKWKLK